MILTTRRPSGSSAQLPESSAALPLARHRLDSLGGGTMRRLAPERDRSAADPTASALAGAANPLPPVAHGADLGNGSAAGSTGSKNTTARPRRTPLECGPAHRRVPRFR